SKVKIPETKTLPAARIADLVNELATRGPYWIIHFSGHGNGTGLYFVTDDGQPDPVPIDRLVKELSALKRPPECLVLSACYSAFDETILSSNRISYIIAPRGEVADGAARKWSDGFYCGLGAGKSIEDAYEDGRRSVD